MAQFLRGKQAGIQKDFSSDLNASFCVLEQLKNFGISSQVSQLAYDPVQSLLGVGTNFTRFGNGQIYVFGRDRITVTFSLPRKGASVKAVQFCGSKLICLDDKKDLTIHSLENNRLVCAYTPPGTVTRILSDSTLDYVLLGMQTGEILAFDIERESLAPFRVANLLTSATFKVASSPVISLEFHPRDIGVLLVGYHEGAVIYSFKQNKAIKSFLYKVPRGAPGGDSDPASMARDRSPRLIQATWHPTGTFILTAHEDTSLVIWDPKDGRIIQARTLTDTNVDKPGRRSDIEPDPKIPISRIIWCANKDPDATAILIAGGMSMSFPTRGMTLWDLGRTPNYATSSWQILTQHFENPQRQRILPIPPNAEVVNFCLIPRSSPWFAGAHDPIAMIGLLSSGEIITSSFPSGFPISPSNQLHVSMTFLHPFIVLLRQVPVEHKRWLTFTENRSSGPPILRGGAEATYPLKRFVDRNIILAAHGDGTVRLWDAGHGDEIENPVVLQADVARAVGKEDLRITEISFAGSSGELAVGLKSGEVAIFRWGHNKQPVSESLSPTPNNAHALTNIAPRRDPSVTEGLLPFTLLDQGDDSVTALRVSDVGFIAAGFQGGSVAVIDMRGPAVIFDARLSDLLHHHHLKLKGTRRGSINQNRDEWATAVEFSVMTIEGEPYSSILLHFGTNQGRVATFKILPIQGGRFGVEFAGSTSLENRVMYIYPINATTGTQASASPGSVASLREGAKVDGALLVVTPTEARIFKPATAKGAHKSWDGVFCDNARVTRCHSVGIALVCLFGDGTARAYAIPSLKEIATVQLNHALDVKRFPEAIVTDLGEVIGWTGPSEVAMLNVWGTGEQANQAHDRLFNPEAIIPPRPTISNFQWVSGTQYITPSDLDIIIGGPDRPPSKRMLNQVAADQQAYRTSASSRGGPATGQQEGWGDYMQRQINARTEQLTGMNDSIERLGESSAGWANDVSEYVSKQKKNLVMGAVKSKFGF